MRDQRPTPPSVHQLDRHEAVHCGPDEVRVGCRIPELRLPAGDPRREHLKGGEPGKTAGVRWDEVGSAALEHEPVERLVLEGERAVSEGKRQQPAPATTTGWDLVESVRQALEAIQVELLEQPLLRPEVRVHAHRRLVRGGRDVAYTQGPGPP